MNFQTLQKFPQIYYSCSVSWNYLDKILKDYVCNYKLEINPDFQRGHVWTEEQQIAYVEYMLRQPQSGKHIYFNHPGWMTSFKGDMVLVDGLQRITAAVRFMNNDLKVYGCYYSEFEGKLDSATEFIFNIAKLPTKKDVIQWYLDFNTGGTPHSKEEIERVKALKEAL